MGISVGAIGGCCCCCVICSFLGKIKVKKWVPKYRSCDNCKGKGKLPIEKYKPCNFCNGRGKVGLDEKTCPGCNGVGHL